MGIVQQMVSPNGGVLAGANFNQDSRDVAGGLSGQFIIKM